MKPGALFLSLQSLDPTVIDSLCRNQNQMVLVIIVFVGWELSNTIHKVNDEVIDEQSLAPLQKKS